MNDRIQLKQEEVVGNEVVLSDINPRTNTKSVDDSSTGTDLQQTIDRIWNTLNNKLSRIVNSVNGRDGCVVITSEDVGLGNVDNVSFADIKQWIINRMDQEFGYKQLIYFESLSDLNVWVGEHNNDAIYDMKPFYVHKWSDEDLRGYIGVFAYEGGLLNANHRMVIDTVGWTDNSIIYNEDVNETHYAGTGKMGVNIWKYEDALEIYDDLSGNKHDSGLRIKKESVVGSLYYFDGAYGTGEPEDSHALVYFDSSSLPIDPSALKSVEFYFNDVLLTTMSTIFLRQSFKIGDLILCDFCRKDNYYDANDIMKNGMISDLIDRYQHLGMVTTAPTMEHPENNYVIKFYAIKPKVSNGLTYKSETLEINPLHAYTGAPVPDFPEGENVSGLTTLSPYKEPTANVDGNYDYMQVTPWGIRHAFSCPAAPSEEASAITINLADSLCMIPTTIPLGMENSWPKDVHGGIDNNDPASDRCDVGSAVGINLVKEIQNFSGQQGLFNMSGLRITSPYQTIDADWWGNDSTTTVGSGSHSGGLSVNVGAFLEIGQSNEFGDTKTIPSTDHSDEHYNWGKVNVRIDTRKGLYDTGNNSLGVKVAGRTVDEGHRIATGCISVDEAGLFLNIGPGMAATSRDFDGNYDTDNKYYITTNIIDPISGSNDTWDTHVNPYEYRWCGGLRYIRHVNTHGGAIGIRINEDDAWAEDPVTHEHPVKGPSYIGSRGLTITHNNVLGVQVAKGFDNCTSLETIQEIIEEKYDSIIFMPNPAQVYDKVEDFPQQGNVDTMYISLEKGFKEHYIWSATDNEYQNMYVFGADVERTTGELNKIYVVLKPDESYYDKIRVELYSWSYWFKTFLPEFDGNTSIDGRDASFISTLYSLASTNKTNILDWSEEIRKRADANQDGVIDERDASMIMTFWAKTSVTPPIYESNITGWRKFIHDEYNIGPDNRDVSHGWQKMYETIILPGIGSRINTSRGITTHHKAMDAVLDKEYTEHASLGISIYDKSAINAHIAEFDKFKFGGLRFAKDGVLAIRVNSDNIEYGVGRGGSSDITKGTRGIGINNENILGIQLTPSNADDNGMLAIDNQGNLIISPNYRPTIDIEKPKPLYIGPNGEHGIAYDGTIQETILLGPGLILVDDDEPDPGEVERLEERKLQIKTYIENLLICDWVCFYKYIHKSNEEILNTKALKFFSDNEYSSGMFLNEQTSFGPLEAYYEKYVEAKQLATTKPVEFGSAGYQVALATFRTNMISVIDEMRTNHTEAWAQAKALYFPEIWETSSTESVRFVDDLMNEKYYPVAIKFYHSYIQYLPSP